LASKNISEVFNKIKLTAAVTHQWAADRGGDLPEDVADDI